MSKVCRANRARSRAGILAPVAAAVFATVVITCGLCAVGASWHGLPALHAQRAYAVQLKAGDSRASAQKAPAVGASGNSAVNIKHRAFKATVFAYGWYQGSYHAAPSKTLKTYDVTGDGRPDKVRIVVTRSADAKGMAKSVSVAVNGQVAYEQESAAACLDQVRVTLLTLQNDRPFLFVSVYGHAGESRQAVLQCKGGRFEKVFGHELLDVAGVSDARLSDVLVTGNRLVAQFDFVSCVTGHTRATFGYAWKNGSLSRSGSTSLAIRYATSAKGGYTRLARKAARAFTAYTGLALDKVAFRVSAGKSVRPEAVSIAGGRLLYKLKYGSKRGWVACATPDVGQSALLRGVYGRVPLSCTPISYAASKAYSISALQKLDNYALFLTRNELYARKGYQFQSAELAAVFQATDWYKPKKAESVKLSRQQQKNAALALAVEKNRKSPYVS